MQDSIDNSAIAFNPHWGGLWAFAGHAFAKTAPLGLPVDFNRGPVAAALDESLGGLAADIFTACHLVEGVRRTTRDMWLSELATSLELAHSQDLAGAAAGIELLFERAAQTAGDRCPDFNQARAIFGQTWPVLLHHLQLDETIVYPLCGYMGQTFNGPLAKLEAFFASLTREHRQIAAAVQLMRQKVVQAGPRKQLCPRLLELAQALEFFSYAWETHTTKVDTVLLPRLRQILAADPQNSAEVAVPAAMLLTLASSQK